MYYVFIPIYTSNQLTKSNITIPMTLKVNQ